MTGDRRLPALLEGLGRARLRIRERLVLREVLLGAAAVLGIVAGARLAEALVPAVRSWTALPQVGSWAAVTLMVAAALWVWLRVRGQVPSVAQLARRADERYGLQERVSTALEVRERRHGVRASALQPLLMTDAAAVSARIEPRALVEIPVGSAVRWAVVALAAFAVVHLVPLRSVAAPTASAPAATDTAAAASGATPVPTVTDVQRAAALVAQDAFVRNDPKLQSIASSLQDLGARMAGGQIQSGAVAREVARLRVELQAAYGQPVAPPDTSAAKGAGAATPKGAPVPPTGTSGAAGQSPVGQGAKVKITSKGSPSSSSLSDLVQQLEAGAPDRSGSKAPGAGSLSQMGTTPGPTLHAPGTYARQDPAQAALYKQANALLDQAGSPGGQPAGAARHATQGPGDAAGQGTQPLAQGAAKAPPKAAPATGAKVDLPTAGVAGGKKIQLDAAPGTHRVQVTDVAPGAAVPGAPPSQTARPVGQIVDGAERIAVGRYFLPNGDAATGTSQGSTP